MKLKHIITELITAAITLITLSTLVSATNIDGSGNHGAGQTGMLSGKEGFSWADDKQGYRFCIVDSNGTPVSNAVDILYESVPLGTEKCLKSRTGGGTSGPYYLWSDITNITSEPPKPIAQGKNPSTYVGQGEELRDWLLETNSGDNSNLKEIIDSTPSSGYAFQFTTTDDKTEVESKGSPWYVLGLRGYYITVEPIIWFRPGQWDSATQSTANVRQQYLYGTFWNICEWYANNQNDPSYSAGGGCNGNIIRALYPALYTTDTMFGITGEKSVTVASRISRFGNSLPDLWNDKSSLGGGWHVYEANTDEGDIPNLNALVWFVTEDANGDSTYSSTLLRDISVNQLQDIIGGNTDLMTNSNLNYPIEDYTRIGITKFKDKTTGSSYVQERDEDKYLNKMLYQRGKRLPWLLDPESINTTLEVNGIEPSDLKVITTSNIKDYLLPSKLRENSNSTATNSTRNSTTSLGSLNSTRSSTTNLGSLNSTRSSTTNLGNLNSTRSSTTSPDSTTSLSSDDTATVYLAFKYTPTEDPPTTTPASTTTGTSGTRGGGTIVVPDDHIVKLDTVILPADTEVSLTNISMPSTRISSYTSSTSVFQYTYTNGASHFGDVSIVISTAISPVMITSQSITINPDQNSPVTISTGAASIPEALTMGTANKTIPNTQVIPVDAPTTVTLYDTLKPPPAVEVLVHRDADSNIQQLPLAEYMQNENEPFKTFAESYSIPYREANNYNDITVDTDSRNLQVEVNQDNIWQTAKVKFEYPGFTDSSNSNVTTIVDADVVPGSFIASVDINIEDTYGGGVTENSIDVSPDKKVIRDDNFTKRLELTTPSKPMIFFPTYEMKYDEFEKSDNPVWILANHEIELTLPNKFLLSFSEVNTSVTAPWSRDINDINFTKETGETIPLTQSSNVVKSGSVYSTSTTVKGNFTQTIYLLDPAYAADKTLAQENNKEQLQEVVANYNSIMDALGNSPESYTNLYNGSSQNSIVKDYTMQCKCTTDEQLAATGSIKLSEPGITATYMLGSGTIGINENRNINYKDLIGEDNTDITDLLSQSQSFKASRYSYGINKTLVNLLESHPKGFEWYAEDFQGILEFTISVDFETSNPIVTDFAAICIEQSDRFAEYDETAGKVVDFTYEQLTGKSKNFIGRKKGFVVGLEYTVPLSWGSYNSDDEHFDYIGDNSIIWLLKPAIFHVKGSVYDLTY